MNAKCKPLLDANPGLAEAFANATGNFVNDVRDRFERYGKLSDKQIAAVLAAAAREAIWAAERAAEAANAKPAPTGKVTITGTILAVRWKDSGYGGSYKMTVAADDGFKAWGTVPSHLIPTSDERNTLPGQRVTFTATVTPSDDDPTFSFFKRPTKATVGG